MLVIAQLCTQYAGGMRCQAVHPALQGLAVEQLQQC